MAAGDWYVNQVAQHRLGRAEIDLPIHGYAMVLCGDGQALPPTFTGASGSACYSDLTDELPNGNGYVQGGEALTGASWSRSGDYSVFDCDDPVFAALGDPTPVDVKYLVIIDTTLSDPPIVAVADANTSSGTGVTVSGQDFTITMSVNGVFRLRQNPPS